MTEKHNVTIGYGPKQLPWYQQVPEFAQGLISPPEEDPVKVYLRGNESFGLEEQSIRQASFEIPPTGQCACEQSAAFQEILQYVNQQKKRFLGYQTEEKISCCR